MDKPNVLKCLNCKINDAVKYSKYSSGKFCGKSCANSFSTKDKRQDINKRVSEKLLGISRGGIRVTKICKTCKKSFTVVIGKKEQVYCTKKCKDACENYRKQVSDRQLKRCSTEEEKNRLKLIGRMGGFGTKGYTKSGIYYQSIFEKRAFELLENRGIKFEPHKYISNSSKISDIYLQEIDLWIELDGINREKNKKWLGKDYDYWLNKLEIYNKNSFNLIIFTSFKEFNYYIDKLVT